MHLLLEEMSNVITVEMQKTGEVLAHDPMRFQTFPSISELKHEALDHHWDQ